MLLTLADKMRPPGCEINQISGKMQGKHDKKGHFNVNEQAIKVCLVTVHAILLTLKTFAEFKRFRFSGFLHSCLLRYCNTDLLRSPQSDLTFRLHGSGDTMTQLFLWREAICSVFWHDTYCSNCWEQLNETLNVKHNDDGTEWHCKIVLKIYEKPPSHYDMGKAFWTLI